MSGGSPFGHAAGRSAFLPRASAKVSANVSRPSRVCYIHIESIARRSCSLFSRKFRFTFHQIAAIIRLAHKYHVQAVFDQAVAALEEAFPSDFDTWERGEATVKFKEEHAICVINLALLVDKPSLLPVALYRCALLGSDVLDGYKRNNKTIERLSMENIKRCIDGRNNLASRALGILLDVFNVGSCPECDTPDTCSPVPQSMLQWALEEEQSTETDVLQSWRGLIETWAPDTEICDYCERALINRDVRARRRVWNDLPEIFDIEEEVGGWVADSSDFSD